MRTLIKTISAAIFAALILSGCNKETPQQYHQAFVTVENPDSTKAFYLRTDDNKRLFTQTDNFIPANRTRLYVLFTIDKEMPKGSEYDSEITLYSAEKILTKDIFSITPETQDSIGTDPIVISNLWIASNYLNIEYKVYCSNYSTVMHYINLVKDSVKHYADGALHFELRHNANNDYPEIQAFGLASFNILPLKYAAEDTDSLTLVIHSKDFSSSYETTKTIGYKLSADINKSRKFNNSYTFPSSAFMK